MLIEGKKHSCNVYATSREECEEKFKVLIVEMRAKLAEPKKQKLKGEPHPQKTDGENGRKKAKNKK